MSIFNINNQTLVDARNLGRVNDLLGDSLGKLSSGSRTSDAASDPAAIGSIGKLNALSKRAQAASTNIQNAGSYVQTANSFMASMSGLLTRMSELTQYATDGTKSASDNALYSAEFTELQNQLRQTIGGSTTEIGGTSNIDKPLGMFNGVVLFGANTAGGITVAAGSSAGQNIVIPETNLRDGSMLELFKQDSSGHYTFSLTDPAATQKITDAIGDLADGRAKLGGVSSRLDLAAQSLTVEKQNISAAVSSIQDVNVATESTRLSKLHILLEGGTAMLSQANQSPKSVLQLLQA